MRFSRKVKMEDIFMYEIFPTTTYTATATKICEFSLPEGGFYDIVSVCESNRSSVEEQEVNKKCEVDEKSETKVELFEKVNNSNNNSDYVSMDTTVNNSGTFTYSPRRNLKRVPPKKPPRRSNRSSSMSSGSSVNSTSSVMSTNSVSSENNSNNSISEYKTGTSCLNCTCDRNKHEMQEDDIVTSYKMNRLSIHDSNDNILIDEQSSDEYLWVPPCLDKTMVAEYMDSLSRERVPHCNNPDGIKYYNKQLLYQIPLQDSNIENIKTLTSKQQYLLDAFKDERDPEMGKGLVTEAGTVKSCGKCRKKIPVGDICVNAPLLGSEAMWHPNCFECSTCNELLINLVYCQKEGDIYCVRHHAEQIKSRCVMCDELIFGGEYIRSDDNAYHLEHFVCSHCERGLSGEQHLVDQGLPICITCYDEKFASTCHMCGKAIGIDEEDVIYDDEHWHDTCLVCHLCRCKLSGTSFVIKDDDFLCSDCYQRTDDKRCSTCGKGFEPGAKRLELKGNYWHDSCFICDICRGPITSKRFIQHEGKQVCCPCFDKQFAKFCDKCKEVMREGGVSCGNAFYHRDCFACENCDTSIASQPFQQKDGKRYCTPCYKKLHAKRCSACDDFIVNGEFYTVDNDNWHKDCFRCQVCNEILKQHSFPQENGKIKLVCNKCMENEV